MTMKLQDTRLLAARLSEVKTYGHFINGEWTEGHSGETIELSNPATRQTLAYIQSGDAVDVDRAVNAAHHAFPRWSKSSPAQRQTILRVIADRLRARQLDYAMMETLNNGKTITEAFTHDITGAIGLFEYYAGAAFQLHGQVADFADSTMLIHREPIGVVAQIIPWNFPLLMAAWKLGPALTTGCTVVLKVAEETPLSALRLAELCQEAGLPNGVLNLLTGFGEPCGAPLAAHAMVDKVAFTGSTEVGKLIVKAASNDLKKVTLELGGKSPNIILDDADMDLAIPGAANAIFFNHGQCCCAGSRLFVQEKKYDQVVEGVTQFAKNIRLGPGLDSRTQMGPLVSQTQLERVSGYLRSGEEQGAKALCGGKRHGENGYFVEPTVLVDTSPDMKVYREEIFGPVVTAIPFKSVDDDLLTRANDTTYGLAAGIYTRDMARAHRIANRLRAGTVWINCYNIFDAALPFGGYKQSGWGREMGHNALDNYLETKSICASI